MHPARSGQGQILTYLDSSLTINAVMMSYETDASCKAALIPVDSSRDFVLSGFVKLETLPKMRYNKQLQQAAITEGLIAAATMDSLHAACAIAAGADELLTFESPTKPFFRIPPEVLKVVSLHSAAAE